MFQGTGERMTRSLTASSPVTMKSVLVPFHRVVDVPVAMQRQVSTVQGGRHVWQLRRCCSLPASFFFFRGLGVTGCPADLPSAPRTCSHVDLQRVTSFLFQQTAHDTFIPLSSLSQKISQLYYAGRSKIYQYLSNEVTKPHSDRETDMDAVTRCAKLSAFGLSNGAGVFQNEATKELKEDLKRKNGIVGSFGRSSGHKKAGKKMYKSCSVIPEL